MSSRANRGPAARPSDADGAPPYLLEPFDSARHDRAAFSCGVEPLDRYFKRQASQDVRRQVAVVFVLRERDVGGVVGYFTLSQSCVRLASIPDSLARKLPRQKEVPATLLGRLAVDTRFRGKGMGKALLVAALRRAAAASAEVASWAVIVDAKDEGVAAFYARFGFAPLQDADHPRRLFLPMRTVADLVTAEGLVG